MRNHQRFTWPAAVRPLDVKPDRKWRKFYVGRVANFSSPSVRMDNGSFAFSWLPCQHNDARGPSRAVFAFTHLKRRYCALAVDDLENPIADIPLGSGKGGAG
jgi:hypothetical protein